MKKNRSFFNSFILKLIAATAMTIDHIGVVILDALYGNQSQIYLIFRIIGRISFPLFAFALVESIFHTHSRKKYLCRLGLCAILISTFSFILTLFNENLGISNVFIDLFLNALIVCLLDQKNKKKLWAIIPITISVLAIVFHNYIPTYLRMSYGCYGIAIIIGFYLTPYLAKKYYSFLAKRYDVTTNQMEDIIPQRKVTNIVAITVFLIINFVCWIIAKIIPTIDTIHMSIQIYAIFSAFFIYFYNGEKGYSSKYVKYGFYLYYFLHVGIIALIFYLI